MKFLILVFWSSLQIIFGQEVGLTLAKTVPLTGVKGRFDHFAVDESGHRLFVAALGNNTIEIMDTAAGKHLNTITQQHKPQGVAYVPQIRRMFVANGGDGTLRVIDGESWQTIKTFNGFDDADNIRLDPNADRLYVGYGDGALAVIDTTAMKQTGRIKLAAHPESFQMERQGTRIFVNVPDAKQIAVIDRSKQSVAETWPMSQFQANFPMALDEADKRLFVGCRSPAQLVVFNTTTGKSIANIAISEDTDDLFFDGTLKRIYVSCGGGFVDVIDQRDADHYSLRERIPTRAGARTSFFSADLNQFYLAVPKRGSQVAEIRIYQPVK